MSKVCTDASVANAVMDTIKVDVLIIGAGAAGLMCAAKAGARGRSVMVVDHANKVGKKILMSGGGRCNFTNMYTEPNNFLSDNEHFCKSALSRYTQWDFIELVSKHEIPYHEKKLGQLFCDNKASDIVHMLLKECEEAGAQVETRCTVHEISVNKDMGEQGSRYRVSTSLGEIDCQSLVVATGGLSIPTMGATGFGYDIAQQFELTLKPRTAALVPFTLSKAMLERLSVLSGSSIDISVSCNNTVFRENLLFTHRGLSGPAILQISSYWKPGDEVFINLLPDIDVDQWLYQKQQERPKAELKTIVSEKMTKQMAQVLTDWWCPSVPMNQLSTKKLKSFAEQLSHWMLIPAGIEGYRTAEVTLGGVDTDELSSKTMEVKKQKGLFFIGEVVDVTGHLGGFNFQWAWASAAAAAEFV
ncbi:NAD(P)/FAD-dependent oxidoreductase [Marinibactrum halimedae]|uniref:Membrane protein n=1 Tax=Marinibactrum halimedae TaxID=1444977 RepID=A0AA37TF77_9GAMM|nr:NAD(P)/FAD-dependent oxidoreductase [Marinibactrum halimedae]MCD9460196.1 NAD(P)/FAD-dependent oxidoreductase [Marinibactrum halimedae]GLS27972.1 membrane protein [Marinibactrum halimedae]